MLPVRSDLNFALVGDPWHLEDVLLGKTIKNSPFTAAPKLDQDFNMGNKC